MRKFIVVLGLILSAILVLTACGGGEKAADTKDGSGVTKEFTINAKNFEFDLKEIKVNKGDTVKVTLKNTDGNHGVKFIGYNKDLQANKTISFVATKAGEFQYECSIFCGPGHDKMLGKLIVE